MTVRNQPSPWKLGRLVWVKKLVWKVWDVNHFIANAAA